MNSLTLNFVYLYFCFPFEKQSSSYRNFNLFHFRKSWIFCCLRFTFHIGVYPISSMPSDLRRIDLHEEPFSTWILSVCMTIIATTNKICTTGSSTYAHAKNASKLIFDCCQHKALHVNGYCTSADNRVQVGLFERHSFSGLINSMGELLHNHNRIPTSMATVPLS